MSQFVRILNSGVGPFSQGQIIDKSAFDGNLPRLIALGAVEEVTDEQVTEAAIQPAIDPDPLLSDTPIPSGGAGVPLPVTDQSPPGTQRAIA